MRLIDRIVRMILLIGRAGRARMGVILVIVMVIVRAGRVRMGAILVIVRVILRLVERAG